MFPHVPPSRHFVPGREGARSSSPGPNAMGTAAAGGMGAGLNLRRFILPSSLGIPSSPGPGPAPWPSAEKASLLCPLGGNLAILSRLYGTDRNKIPPIRISDAGIGAPRHPVIMGRRDRGPDARSLRRSMSGWISFSIEPCGVHDDLNELFP